MLLAAQTATRSIEGTPRKTNLMVPLFDMANHYEGCGNFISG